MIETLLELLEAIQQGAEFPDAFPATCYANNLSEQESEQLKEFYDTLEVEVVTLPCRVIPVILYGNDGELSQEELEELEAYLEEHWNGWTLVDTRGGVMESQSNHMTNTFDRVQECIFTRPAR